MGNRQNLIHVEDVENFLIGWFIKFFGTSNMPELTELQERKIWEFYNPIDGDIKKLKRKGKDSGPFSDYLGHNPLLSLQRISEGENIWFVSL